MTNVLVGGAERAEGLGRRERKGKARAKVSFGEAVRRNAESCRERWSAFDGQQAVTGAAAVDV